MLRTLTIAALLVLLSGPAVARSKAADYLIQEQIAQACESQKGQIDPSSAIERDLTGDGNADLIISHEGIQCSGSPRSSFCGAQVCSVNIYVRRGALLDLELETLGAGVSVGGGRIPPIRMHGHGGRARTLRWDGRAFR